MKVNALCLTESLDAPGRISAFQDPNNGLSRRAHHAKKPRGCGNG